MCLSVTLRIVDLYKGKCNPLHPLYIYGALSVRYVPVRVTRGASLMRVLAAEPRSVVGLFFNFQYLCGRISVNPYSMVWYFRISRAGSMSLYSHSCSLPFRVLLFSLSLLSFYGLVLWGLGLRTDRVLIVLSQPCITKLF